MNNNKTKYTAETFIIQQRGVAGDSSYGGERYISRSFHLNLSSNCTVSAKHSVNALKGLMNLWKQSRL